MAIKTHFLYRGVTQELENEEKIAEILKNDADEFDKAVVKASENSEGSETAVEPDITVDQDSVTVEEGKTVDITITSANKVINATSDDSNIKVTVSGKKVTVEGKTVTTNAKVKITSGDKTKQVTVAVTAKVTSAAVVEEPEIVVDNDNITITGKNKTKVVKVTSESTNLKCAVDTAYTDKISVSLTGKNITVTSKNNVENATFKITAGSDDSKTKVITVTVN